MHELGLCQEILRIALEEVDKQETKPKKITSLKLVVGSLHNVLKENMEFIYEHVAKDTIAEGSKLLIEAVPLTIKCNSCQKETIIENNFFSCSACSSRDFEIIKGKELFLENVEVE